MAKGDVLQHQPLTVFDEHADESEQLADPGHGAEIMPGVRVGSRPPVSYCAESLQERALEARTGFSVAAVIY